MMLLIYILIGWGLSNIVCNEYIFNNLKNKIKIEFFKNLLGCSTCFGFWCGLLLFLLIQPFTITGILYIDIILGGCIISGVNNLLENIKIKFN